MKRFLFLALFLFACGGGSGGSGGSGGNGGSGGSSGSGGSGGAGGSGGSGGSGGHDASDVDSLPVTCGYMEAGTCEAAEQCFCCPGAGPTQHCLCTTQCQTDNDCHDTTRPHCEHDPSNQNGPGFCTPPQTQFACCWLCG